MTTSDVDDNKVDLLLETATIPWRELQYFFAGGKAIYVHPDLDLINVANQFATDNKVDVENCISKQQIGPVSNDQARHWYDTDANVWAVVVKPWVLVQHSKDA